MNSSFTNKTFIESYFKVRTDKGPQSILLNDLTTELAQYLDEANAFSCIARYPRRFGKTTVLAGCMLRRMLSHEITIGYAGGQHNLGMYFLQAVAFAHCHLPHILQLKMTEHPTRLQIGKSSIILIGERNEERGCKFDLRIYDDEWSRRRAFHEGEGPLVDHSTGQKIIVGTFPPRSAEFKFWCQPSWNWDVLPSPTTKWQMETILSLCNENLRKDWD
jgi:hypothetical protein